MGCIMYFIFLVMLTKISIASPNECIPSYKQVCYPGQPSCSWKYIFCKDEKPLYTMGTGKNVIIDHAPFLVNLRMHGNVTCSGVIVSPMWILTTAYCANKVYQDPLQLKVHYGTLKIIEKGKFRKVSNVIIHPNFCYKRWIYETRIDNNIALLKVSKPIKFTTKTKAAKLPEQSNNELPQNKKAYIFGWGTTTEDTPSSDSPKYGKVVIMSRQECRENNLPLMETSKSIFCTKNDTPDKENCYADNGSPLDLNGEVIGLASGSLGFCSSVAFSSLYTQVSMFRNWIRKHIG